jgi:hypothetical protein
MMAVLIPALLLLPVAAIALAGLRPPRKPRRRRHVWPG